MAKTGEKIKDFNIVLPFTIKEDATTNETITIEGFASFHGVMDEEGNGAFVDFSDDVVEVAGLDVKWYKKNPVILYQHQREYVIGKAANVTKKPEGLWISAEIHKAAMEDQDFYKIAAGLIRQFSIGFSVKKVEFRQIKDRDVCFIIKSELREVSCVSIACNAMSNYSVMKAYGEDGISALDFDNDDNKEFNETTNIGDESMKVKRRDTLSADDVIKLETLGFADKLDELVDVDLAKYIADIVKSELVAAQVDEAKRIEEVAAQAKAVEVAKQKEEADAKEAELATSLGLTVEELKALTPEEVAGKTKEIEDKLEAEKQEAIETAERFKSLLETLENTTKTLTAE